MAISMPSAGSERTSGLVVVVGGIVVVAVVGALVETAGSVVAGRSMTGSVVAASGDEAEQAVAMVSAATVERFRERRPRGFGSVGTMRGIERVQHTMKSAEVHVGESS